MKNENKCMNSINWDMIDRKMHAEKCIYKAKTCIFLSSKGKIM